MASDDITVSLENMPSPGKEQEEEHDFVLEDICEASEPGPSNRKRCLEEDKFQYEVLTADQIFEHRTKCIKEVSSLVQLPTFVTQMLLNYMKWDKESLIECYFSGDPDKLFSDAHIMPLCNDPLPSSIISSDESTNASGSLKEISESAECVICLLACSSTTMTGLRCGHVFCSQCWSHYLTTQIMTGGMGHVPVISCAAFGCDILVDDESLVKFISDPEVLMRYQKIMLNNFVECNRLLRWCPSPDCGHVIKALLFEERPVTCVCGHAFCFACGEDCHMPVPCKWLKIWTKRCEAYTGATCWISRYTRDCPKCHTTIEKISGCNHMVCTVCTESFCWLCVGHWQKRHKCCGYDEDEANKTKDAQKSRAALQRFVFFYNRFMTHMQSLEFEQQMYANITAKMEEMQQQHLSWMEVQFLRKAVDVLCECRETLRYTYIFAFYLKTNNQSLIFEDNQKDLENATEQLSEFLERDITSKILVDIKQKVQDKTRYCSDRRQVLLDHVLEGCNKDLWQYEDVI